MPGDSVAHEEPWAGFWGKLPSRGDFVRWGLPRDFLTPWDAWLSAVVAEACRRLDGAWDAAWDVAAPCRFLLVPGLCGPYRVAGVWLPGRDRVRRIYPLTFATEVREPPHEAGPFIRHAEDAGWAALRDGLDPATLAARLSVLRRSAGPDEEPPPWPARGGLWRQGGAWVACDGLPDAGMFVSLLLGGDKP